MISVTDVYVKPGGTVVIGLITLDMYLFITSPIK